MPLDVLRLRTEESLHEIACPQDSSIDLGSESDCEIVLEGAGILPRHCVFRRVGEKRFRVTAAVPVAHFVVNGVTAGDLEVEVPFTFGINNEGIVFDLGSEEQDAPPEEATDDVATTEEATNTAATRTNRRDYLLQPSAVKPRAGERVGEVLIEAPPVIETENTAPKVAVEVPSAPPVATADVPPVEAPAPADSEESTSLFFSGLLICGLMIGAIFFWQRHWNEATADSGMTPAATTTSSQINLSPEAVLRACRDLRLLGVSVIASHLLVPRAEAGDVEATHELALCLHASGEYGDEVVFLLQQAAEGGQREAWADLVREVDHAENPARFAKSSFELLERAAALGESSAWMPLGERYEHGDGTEVNVKQALTCFQNARAAGDMRAVPKLNAKQAALDRAAAFVRSWNEVSVTSLLDHVSATPGKFFLLEFPPMDALLRMEEEMRTRWPLRRISVAADAKAEIETFDLIKVSQPFQFEVQRGERTARGKGVLQCTVQRDKADEWRVTAAEDAIELTEMLPEKNLFAHATSLRELRPAFTHEEQLEEARMEIVRAMRGLESTQDFKPPITALMNAVFEFPQETFWRPFADTLCDRMARQLFLDGKWLDTTWTEPVHQLSQRGCISAMLLEGHLLAAGYGMQRDMARSVSLYKHAFEVSKRRDARFYYAEALFQGRGVPQDVDKANALVLSFMTRSKHPLEAYLAAHLLWRKAESDPSLWQQVYDTLSHVTDTFPPAKNLAGMVLLNHGKTTKERKTGFAAIKAAAEEGVVEAMKNLVNCYQEGISCDKDPQAAMLWKQKALVTEPPRRRHFTEFEE